MTEEERTLTKRLRELARLSRCKSRDAETQRIVVRLSELIHARTKPGKFTDTLGT